jgi:hypothetical protein
VCDLNYKYVSAMIRARELETENLKLLAEIVELKEEKRQLTLSLRVALSACQFDNARSILGADAK